MGRWPRLTRTEGASRPAQERVMTPPSRITAPPPHLNGEGLVCAPAARGSASMSQALSGVRVIDMTHNQAGPACTQILGFLGADVIKLEEPTGGDIARTNLRDQKNSDSLFFLVLNANKRSLT